MTPDQELLYKLAAAVEGSFGVVCQCERANGILPNVVRHRCGGLLTQVANLTAEVRDLRARLDLIDPKPPYLVDEDDEEYDL